MLINNAVTKVASGFIILYHLLQLRMDTSMHGRSIAKKKTRMPINYLVAMSIELEIAIIQEAENSNAHKIAAINVVILCFCHSQSRLGSCL